MRPDYKSMTLRQFFDSYVKPVCVSPDVTPGYLEQVDIALRRWEQIVGTPKLAEITAEMLAEFRAKLLAWEFRGKPVSPATVRAKLKIIHSILAKAGPANRYCRDAAEVLPRTPWVRPPRAEQGPVKVASDEQIEAAYGACDMMDVPVVDGIPAPTYWRSLLAVALSTGLRRRNLVGATVSEQGIKFDYIDWEQRLLVMPAAMMKMKREHVIPLNDVAIEYLQRMRGLREYVFPWPFCWRYLDQKMHELQWNAGIPTEYHFGFHTLRRTAGTKIAGAHGVEAAKMILGHQSTAITRQHYVWAGEGMRRAMDSLPMPQGFGGVLS